MTNSFIYNNHSISYKRFGSGPEVLLCFHGFGLTSESFNYLENLLSNGYTCYAIDFFYHGHSEHPSGEFSSEFSSDYFSKLISQFLNEMNIVRFNIIAYSMGARLSMVLMERMTKIIDRIVFIAPDGIYDSFWFKLSTKYRFGLYLFKKFTENPAPFYAVMNLAISLRIINAKKKKFAEINTNNIRKRRQVFNTWILLENLRFNRNNIGQKINDNNLNFNVIAGKFDTVIITNKLLQWDWLKKNQQHLIIIKSGHAMNEDLLLDTITTYKLL